MSAPLAVLPAVWACMPAAVAVWLAASAAVCAWRIPACARASTSLMSAAFLALTSSSSLSLSLIGSVCFLTHTLRAKGLTRPQKPSFAGACCDGEATELGCTAWGGVLWGVVEDWPCWASAGIPTADASRMTANWLGKKLRVEDLILILWLRPSPIRSSQWICGSSGVVCSPLHIAMPVPMLVLLGRYCLSYSYCFG